MVPAQPKVNFLGFPKFLCPSCHKNVTHPLATARLVIYGLIAVLAIGWSIKIAIDGAIPGLMLAAVIMDFGARSQMAKARQRHQQTPP